MLQYLKTLKYLSKPPCQCIKNNFSKIFHSSPVYPSLVMDILYFVAWLHDQKKSHNSIRTYFAGNSYHHRTRELPGPTQFFIIKKPYYTKYIKKIGQIITFYSTRKINEEPFACHVYFKLLCLFTHGWNICTNLRKHTKTSLNFITSLLMSLLGRKNLKHWHLSF